VQCGYLDQTDVQGFRKSQINAALMSLREIGKVKMVKKPGGRPTQRWVYDGATKAT
jgi:hypothetical protein